MPRRESSLKEPLCPGCIGFDRTVLDELASLRFLDAHAHVAIVGPVGVGKIFRAHAIGHIACRRGGTVLAARTDHLLKTLKRARLDNGYEAEVRKAIAVDFMVLDDVAIDALDATESRDLQEILIDRYQVGSVMVTSNRGPDEWRATFADPVRAQSAIDRFTSNAYDLVIEGESYQPRLKPRFTKQRPEAGRSPTRAPWKSPPRILVQSERTRPMRPTLAAWPTGRQPSA